ncbi:MAG: tRNA (adenosine(37)-N6)-threonylcarbamoyltransferase complex dimerization subunit type 1 TsaB [Bacteroidota bacterium]
MALILQIETATATCSVSIAKNGVTIATKSDEGARNHAQVLVPNISELLQTSGIIGEELDAIAVSKGPGSYTGLRIGVSTAKGLCYAWEKPMVAVNTLESMAAWFASKNRLPIDYFCPMIDAKRLEVYTALFSNVLDTVQETQALILGANSFSEQLNQKTIVFFGDGASKFEKLLNQNHNTLFINDFKANSEGMNALALNLFQENRFESVAYFEPFYLKDFYSPTTPA